MLPVPKPGQSPGPGGFFLFNHSPDLLKIFGHVRLGLQILGLFQMFNGPLIIPPFHLYPGLRFFKRCLINIAVNIHFPHPPSG